MKKRVYSVVAVFSIILTVVMGGLQAFSADADPIAPDEGSLTIHKYLYDAEGIGEGNGKELGNLGNLAGKELRGVHFDVYKIGVPVISGDPEVVPGGDTWRYTKISDSIMEATDGTSTYRYNILKENGSGKTDDSGSLKLSNLDRGYYFVVENLGTDNGSPVSNPEIYNQDKDVWESVTITSPSRPFVVAVPMTDPDDLNDWITDVHVYPKNQSSEIIKKPSQPSVNVGDLFNWEIAVELPADIEEYQKFVVTDKLDEALTYTAGTVKVYQAEKNAQGIWVKITPEKVLTIDTDYSVIDPTTGNSNTLTIELVQSAGFTAVKGWKGLIVEFETKVNEKLQDKDVNIIGNKATVEFTNTQGEDSKKETEISEVNVGDIIIEKVDEKLNPLPGAEFQIARTEAEAKAGQFIKVILDGGKIIGFAYPDEGDKYRDADDWIVTSDSTNGFAKFEGLLTHTVDSEGLPVYKKYYVVETKAPDGYNLVGDPIEVDFADSTKQGEKLTYNIERDVENKKGFTLPNTGGIGTIILTVLGIVLVGLAIIFSLNGKKKKTNSGV